MDQCSFCSLLYWLFFRVLSCFACPRCRPAAASVCVCLCAGACTTSKVFCGEKQKGTKENTCICYSLSYVLLTLRTTPDGILVNAKRAGAISLSHSKGFLMWLFAFISSVGCKVHNISWYTPCVCVFVCVWWRRSFFRSLLLEDTFISAKKEQRNSLQGTLVSVVLGEAALLRETMEVVFYKELYQPFTD